MPATKKAHRASAQRRRDALLEAAAELSAELGAGAVTHRAVAARAGVPLSTTSYFFASIDDLVTEALKLGSEGRFEELKATERAALSATEQSAAEAIAAATERALSTPRSVEGDQIEFFLAAGRQDDLRAEAAGMVQEFTDRIEAQLEHNGAPQAADAAWTLTALGDGAMLHHFAEIFEDHPRRLEAGLRLVVAAAMMTDEEIEAMLGRYERALPSSS